MEVSYRNDTELTFDHCKNGCEMNECEKQIMISKLVRAVIGGSSIMRLTVFTKGADNSPRSTPRGHFTRENFGEGTLPRLNAISQTQGPAEDLIHQIVQLIGELLQKKCSRQWTGLTPLLRLEGLTEK